MDFTFSEEQEAVRQSAQAVFTGMVTPDRVREIEDTEEKFDRALWAELAKADLLGLVLPEGYGGGGYGMVELSLLLEAQGAVVAPVPLWATLVLGALPLAQFGSEEQGSRWLPGVASGNVVLSGALADVAGDLANGGPGRPSVVASPRKKSGYKLSGTAFAVPYAHVADRVLVPAATPDGGTVIALVDPRADEVNVEPAVTTNREVHPHLHFDKLVVTEADLLVGGDPARGASVVSWILERAWTGLSALQVGVAEAALAQTAEYLNTREQFGKPLSTFQGTMLRAADAAIDTEAIRVTLWQAAWRLDNGLDAHLAVTVAIWFASDAGQRVVHATQHLHGGMGADVDYPVHRYFLWGKQIELLLGAGSSQLARLGSQLVADLRAGEVVSA
ncbi:MAG TPA: acyl-CoA dehydrogenase family protein [Acidimicrobiales bacterium]|jgi:alkylation response protein AidB-like acyl-CoA dehydrogenase|nr:acyl-CoA dehydrogenase family protein [Acidimicrobiales bacterium]